MADGKKKFKSGELQDIVLESIANFLIGAGGVLKPRLNVIIGEIIKIILKRKKIKIEEQRIKRVLRNLERKDLVLLEEKEDKIFVHIKENGKSTITKCSIKLLLDFKKKEKKWDGKWFLVFFDVPEKQRVKRDYLRKFLLKFGFYPYQKSVYIFPYECEREISLIKKIVEGAKYMKYIIAEKIEDEEKIKVFFKL